MLTRFPLLTTSFLLLLSYSSPLHSFQLPLKSSLDEQELCSDPVGLSLLFLVEHVQEGAQLSVGKSGEIGRR